MKQNHIIPCHEKALERGCTCIGIVTKPKSYFINFKFKEN